MCLFAAGADFGYCIFLAVNEEFMDVFVRAPVGKKEVTLVNPAADWRIVVQQRV